MATSNNNQTGGRTTSMSGLHRSDWAIKGQQMRGDFKRAAAGEHQKSAEKGQEKPGAAHHREPPAHEKHAAGKEQAGASRERFDRIATKIAQRQHTRELGLGR